MIIVDVGRKMQIPDESRIKFFHLQRHGIIIFFNCSHIQYFSVFIYILLSEIALRALQMERAVSYELSATDPWCRV